MPSSQTKNLLQAFIYTLLTVFFIAIIIFYATPFLAVTLAYLAGIITAVVAFWIWKKLKIEFQNNFKFDKKTASKPKSDYIDVKVN